MQKIVNIPIELCYSNAILPKYARPGDAGMDIRSVEDVLIYPKQTVVVKTGIKLAIPEGYEVQVRPRSGLSLKTGIRVANSPGTIDTGYRDEIGVILHNTGMEIFEVKKGDRIAQIVLKELPKISWQLVDNVSVIGKNRGGGFGSSGLK